jgi:hypothetical protein
VAYAAKIEQNMLELSRNVDRLIRSTTDVTLQWEKDGIQPIPAYAAADSVRRSAAYVAAWPKISNDPVLRAAYQGRKAAFSNRVFYLERMLGATDSLRQAVALLR